MHAQHHRQSSFSFIFARGVGLSLALLVTAGCNEHPLDGVEAVGNLEGKFNFDFEPKNRVDILFVLDNSGSMGEEQANLAANFGAFVDKLELAGADYRLAVTTTDTGNVWCGSTTPEHGALQASSCRERIEHFTSQNGTVNVADIACNDVCGLDSLGLRPSAIEGQEGSQVRPWIQAGGQESNLPEGVGATEAFACMAPQGIDGCGFESPLEALRLALARTLEPQDPAFGFFRDDAMLSVVIVTDEADCSATPFGASIFEQGGGKTFWADPADTFPTSAVCWNAGVRCSGDPADMDCQSADLDPDGTPTSDPERASLRPVSEYIEVLQAYDAGKVGGRGVHVALLGGVPSDLAEVGITYADSNDAQFQHDYGIGAGCSGNAGGASQTAIPPVRLREFVEAFDDTQLFSVCEEDYTNTLEAVVDSIGPALRGACVPRCLEDTDLVTPGVQPLCTVSETYADKESVELPECELIAGAPEVPEGADSCILIRGDIDASTPQDWDDASVYCDPSEAVNTALELYRREGTAAPAGSRLVVTCKAAVHEEVSCPHAG